MQGEPIPRTPVKREHGMNTHNPHLFGRSTHDSWERRPRPLPVSLEPATVLTSEALFHGTREIGIQHAGSLYRLKITRQGKLILNK